MTSVARTTDAELGAAGRVIAQKYRLESLIGEGGMGAVWRAFNLQLEVPVAIKLLRAGMNATDLGERLRIEARAVAKLVHPSIVRVYDIGESEAGDPFIVMELLQGESLSTVLERGPLSAVSALQLLLPIGEALSLAHSRGVVHRDLKPDNIFIASAGVTVQPKLLDFGIAKVRSACTGSGATVTQTGTLLGSPEYMSPEQAYGRSDIDERSDVWAFCVVLYEAISGRPPFEGDSYQVILRSVVSDAPRPLELLGEVDERLSALILWGLNKDRDARPASMLELGRALAAWLFARGVPEDATGSSLETKWLGRATEMISLTTPHGVRTPDAEHDDATLVSVVHPALRASYDSFNEPTVRRRRRSWAPTVVALSCALAAGLGWASVYRIRRIDQPASAALQTPSAVGLSAPPATAAPVAVRAETITVETLPLEPKPAPPSTGSRYAGAKAATTTPPTRTAMLRSAPTSAASTLPRALPPREPHTELINPY
jgi:eukaryotic-like serine/threonine-protein kinase